MEPYALIGPASRREAFLAHSQAPTPAYQSASAPTRHDLLSYPLIVDLTLDEHPQRLSLYAYRPEQVLLGGAVRHSLHEMAYQAGIPVKGSFIGLNALPTFLERPCWEMSHYHPKDQRQTEALAQWLGVEVQIVPDQVGMITPRTLFLLINEAYTVMQEGTASAADIDLAMQLGTNYPRGPIAWSEAIGLEAIVAVLDHLHAHTGEGRYRVSPLLRRRMMRAASQQE